MTTAVNKRTEAIRALRLLSGHLTTGHLAQFAHLYEPVGNGMTSHVPDQCATCAWLRIIEDGLLEPYEWWPDGGERE